MEYRNLPSRALAACLAAAGMCLLAACGGGGGGQPAVSVHAEQWAKTYGGAANDSASAVQPTTDGGYIVAGHTGSFGAGELEAWVLKLDSGGNLVWQKTFGAGTAGDVKQTADGGYIVAGQKGNAWIFKLDIDGNVVWQRTYSGAGADTAAVSVQATPDGGYVVAGSTRSFGADLSDNSDTLVLKLDSAGNVVWQETYDLNRYDRANYIQLTADGGYIVAGDTADDAWILKLDADGKII